MGKSLRRNRKWKPGQVQRTRLLVFFARGVCCFKTDRGAWRRGKQQFLGVSATNEMRFGAGLGRLEKLDEYPLLQPTPGTLRQRQKLYASLPHRVSPRNSARAFDTHPRVRQFE